MNMVPGKTGGDTTGVAFTIPARWYHDPEIWARERARVFGREWLLVGHQGQVENPGDYVAGEIAGWRFFVIRGRDGGLKGFHNVCSHRAGPLLDDGAGHCDVLRCRYHRWVYDSDGRLKATPDFGEAPGFDRADYGLKPIKVAEWRGLIFANLDPDAGPVEAGLGALVDMVAPYPIEDYRSVRQVTFDIACNWKTYTDNFVEGYHIPGIHPGLNAAIDFKGFAVENRPRIVIMSAPQRDGSIYEGVWLWRYPNTTLSVFSGGMNTSSIIALDRGHTRLIYNFYFADPAAPENERIIETNCQIVREDFGICEIAQGNLEAGIYDRGPLSPRQESGVRHFHEMLECSLGEAP